jgi:hypothetical protein
MPLLMPKQRGVQREASWSGRPANNGTVVTSDSVAHTLPSTYTELIAATSFDSYWVNITVHSNHLANTNSDSLLNIYVGASSAEQVLIPNLLAGWAASTPHSNALPLKRYGFPLRIPAGTRLSARHQSVRTSTGVTVQVELLGGDPTPHWVGTRVECVGGDTATSRGVAVTPGTTSEGTLTSIGTSTYEWGFVQPMIGGNIPDTTMNAHAHAADIGSGAATVIAGLEDFYFLTSNAEWSANYSDGRFCLVPAGTTLYLRSQFGSTAESNDWCIYGVA